ncbi:hypothetical protein ACFL5H_04360, partial [Candidatus Latescibacterota bacterium]
MMNQEMPDRMIPPKRDRRSRPLSRRITAVMVKQVLLAGIAFICAGLFILVLVDTIIMPVLLKSGTEIVAPDLIGVQLEQTDQRAE